MIAALRTYSLDKLQYQRETESGISSLAHFLSKDTIDMFNIIIKPVAYLSMFYFFNNPRSSFQDNYVILMALVYCVTGMAYVLAISFAPSLAQLVCSKKLLSFHELMTFFLADELNNFVVSVGSACSRCFDSRCKQGKR